MTLAPDGDLRVLCICLAAVLAETDLDKSSRTTHTGIFIVLLCAPSFG